MATRKYQPPHHTLGTYLKTMRQRLQETLGETSGAVELDVTVLDKIERGEELPSEDILLLLINHFSLRDDEADKLWHLAGYEHDDETADGRPTAQNLPMMLIAFDNRVVYSNSAEIISDDAGMVINFGQSFDSAQHTMPVARIGMSYDQAEKVLSTLQTALLHRRYGTGNRLLPPGCSK